jgi:BASS family bile acid:Na+ symporter
VLRWKAEHLTFHGARMQSNVLTAVVMPIAIGIIMLGLGLSLTLEDFKRVVKFPRAIIVGLFCQMVLLPVVCFYIAKGFGLAPELAVGLMLLAASPGGATANLYSHLAKGDVALNITLTATNSVLSLFTMPFLVNFALEKFMGEGKAIPLQFDKVIQVFAIVLVPVLIGMAVRSRAKGLADRLQKPVKITSAVVLLLVVLGAVVKERGNFLELFRQAGPAALVFNLSSMAIGYCVPLLARVKKKQAIAIGMEIGIHNGTLAMTIAMSPLLLNNGTMAIPPAVYSVLMFLTAALFGFAVSRGAPEAEEAEPAATKRAA